MNRYCFPASRAFRSETSEVQPRPDLGGILAQVEHGGDDDSRAMDAVENPVLKASHQKPPELSRIHRGGFGQLNDSGQARPYFGLKAVPQPRKSSS